MAEATEAAEAEKAAVGLRDASKLLSLACRKRWAESSVEPARAIWDAMREDGQMPTRVALQHFASTLALAGPVHETLWREVSQLAGGKAKYQVPRHLKVKGGGQGYIEGNDECGAESDSDSGSGSSSGSGSGSDSDSDSYSDSDSDSDSDAAA